MPSRIEIDHYRLHIQAAIDNDGASDDIIRQGRVIIDSLDAAPINAIPVVVYLDSDMSRVVTLDTTQVRVWLLQMDVRNIDHPIDLSDRLERGL